MRARLLTKFDLCTGCRICELVCSFVKEDAFNPGYARLRIEVAEDGLFNHVEVCIQCDNPACMRVCPTGAIVRDPSTQAILLEQGKCNGCAACITYCSIGMIHVPPGAAKPVKCDLCGGTPQCALFCPTEAIFTVQIPDVKK